MDSTFATWSKVCAHHGIPQDDWTLDGKYNAIRFKNGSTIDFLDVAYKPTDLFYERFEPHRMALVPSEISTKSPQSLVRSNQRDIDKDGKLKIVGRMM